MLYDTGVIIGGFQPLHIGHENLINTGLKLCNKLCIYIGERKNTEENLFSFNTRRELIEIESKFLKMNINQKNYGKVIY